MSTATNRNPNALPSSWLGALAGSALFILFGLTLILYEIPHEWNWQWSYTLSQVFFFLNLLLPPVFYAVGWVKGFPAWSYPYIAHLLQWSFYMMNVATPGLRVFNYTFGSNDLWGWRAWIMFALATGIALLITRSFNPLLNLIRDGRQDWTRYTFGMFGLLPLWVIISFDEMDRLYSLYFMFLLAVIMPVTALVYLRSRSIRGRAVALLAGILITIAVCTIAPTLYWLQNGWVSVPGSILMGICILLVLLSPALIGWMHKKADRGEKSTKISL